MPSRGRAGSAAALLAVLAVSGCGSDVGESVLPGGVARFDEQRVTWAQGSTVHYGNDEHDLGRVFVKRIVPSAYGWVVQVAEKPGRNAARDWRFFDGTDLHPLDGDIDEVRASPDGRYLGWVDRDGPDRPAGRVAEVVVVDLASGEVVLTDHDGMGGDAGDDLDDLYSELPPTFLGFDDDYAYWTNATGHGERRRAEIGSWEVSEAREPDPDEDNTDVGIPFDAYAGARVGVLEDGRWDLGGRGGVLGTLAPSRAFVATVGENGQVSLHEAESGRPVQLRTGHRFAWFGGWVEAGAGEPSAYLLARDRFEGGWDPSAPDRTRGWLTECVLATGRCTDLVAVRGTRSVVLPADGFSDRGAG